MNTFRVSNVRSNRRRMIPQDEDGINFAQHGEEAAEADEVQTGVNMPQQGQETATPDTRHTYQYQRQELSRGGQKKSKKAVFEEPDSAKEHAKRDKQESPEVATATCIHCGGNHHLAECPVVTQDQLG